MSDEGTLASVARIPREEYDPAMTRSTTMRGCGRPRQRGLVSGWMLGTLADAQRGITAASRECDQRPETPSPSPSPSLLSTMPAEVPFDFDASVFPDSWVLQWVDGLADAASVHGASPARICQ